MSFHPESDFVTVKNLKRENLNRFEVRRVLRSKRKVVHLRSQVKTKDVYFYNHLLISNFHIKILAK